MVRDNARRAAVISSPDLGVFAVAAAGVLCSFGCLVDGYLNSVSALVFRSYAAAACQAASTCWVCSGVGSALEPAEIRAAIMVRRSWVSMSSKAGSVLVRYQGWSRRRAARVCRGWPCRAYQVTT